MSDHIVYVQNIQQITEHHHDEFSFYISDGYTQTEAFHININIQVEFSNVFNIVLC